MQSDCEERGGKKMASVKSGKENNQSCKKTVARGIPPGDRVITYDGVGCYQPSISSSVQDYGDSTFVYACLSFFLAIGFN